jgi:hypothetical protein
LIRTLDLCSAAGSIDLVAAVAFAAELKSISNKNHQHRIPIHNTFSNKASGRGDVKNNEEMQDSTHPE